MLCGTQHAGDDTRNGLNKTTDASHRYHGRRSVVRLRAAVKLESRAPVTMKQDGSFIISIFASTFTVLYPPRVVLLGSSKKASSRRWRAGAKNDAAKELACAVGVAGTYHP